MLKNYRYVFVLLLPLFLIGCASLALSNHVVEEEGQYFLQIPEVPEPIYDGIIDFMKPVVLFDSVGEMMTDIQNLSFTDDEMTEISRFSLDEQGRRICSVSPEWHSNC